ncbi:MAG: hypothetical protein ACI8SE_000848 [Bacteroidia bacterium]|jgi:hypothetical protein
MKLSEVKSTLQNIGEVRFKLPDGSFVPQHFHVTEIGAISKNFIDCGGKVRKDDVVNFQLWEANDFDHRIAPSKFTDIIQLSENILKLHDAEVEVEYQSETIGKYGLTFDGENFVLTNTHTDCLAKDNCGIPSTKIKRNLATVGQESGSCCTPGGGCC